MSKDEIVDYLKIPHFFRDIIILMSGMIFLFFLNYLYKPNISGIPNINYFGDVIKIMFGISSSYFLGRVLLEISDIWIDIWLFILRGDYINRAKGLYADFFSSLSVGKYNIPFEPNTIEHERYCFLEKNVMLRDMHERIGYTLIFLRLLLGLLFFGTFILMSLKLFGVLLLVTLIAINQNKEMSGFDKMIAKAVVKERRINC